LTYSIFASCLKREKERYQKEKDARYALLKRNSDDEDLIGQDGMLMINTDDDD